MISNQWSVIGSRWQVVKQPALKSNHIRIRSSPKVMKRLLPILATVTSPFSRKSYLLPLIPMALSAIRGPWDLVAY